MSKPSKYGHSVTEHAKGYDKKKEKEKSHEEKLKEFPTEPQWKEFRETYEKELGRHSVNYHSWYYVKDDGFFKDFWDMQMTRSSESFHEKYGKDRKFEIEVENVITGEKDILKMEGGYGNPDNIFGGGNTGGILAMLTGGPDHYLPFAKLEKAYLDGFCILKTSKLFPIRGSLSLTMVDNDHWPALRRGSIILINDKYRDCAVCPREAECSVHDGCIIGGME